VVKVDVGDRLPGLFPVVDLDVAARLGEFPSQHVPRLFQGLKDSLLFAGLQFEERPDVTFRDDKGVAFRHGEPIANRDREVWFGDDPVLLQVT
jgi:hypothetical protein